MRLTAKGFFPYLVLVFLNTFTDVGHKILIQDTLYQTVTGSTYTIFSSVINALILIPYILLFTPSGFIADKFSKAKVLKVTAAAAIPLTILITWCYYMGFFWGAFTLTLLLAVQSALNSPAKYGFIKEMFGKEELSRVNAIVQTLTIIAILGATFAFTSLFSYFIHSSGLAQSIEKSSLLKAFAPAGFLLIGFSIFETYMTFLLIQKEPVDPQSEYEVKNYFKGTYVKSYLQKIHHPRVIFTCIMGLAVFWAVNQVLLASYGAFLQEHIGHVSVIFAQGSLAMAGIGILLGALYAGKVSKGFIESGLIPIASIGITLGLLILPLLTSQLSIVLLFLAYGFFGGMLVVPLNALIQFNSPRKDNGKILSANNFIQNCAMLGFLVLTVGLGYLKVDSKTLMHGLFVISFIGTCYTLFRLPQSLVRYVLYVVTSRFYRLGVYQLENLPSAGGVLLLGNHVSFIDWAILQVACPRPIRFVMEKSIYEAWYLKWMLKKFRVIPIAQGASHQALNEINKALSEGEVVALFPEGRLTRNGQMGVFKSGFERAIQNTNAVIVPFYINGLWGSKTSYASAGKTLTQPRHRVQVIYGASLPSDSKASLVKHKVTKLSIRAWKYAISEMGSIQEEWFYQAQKKGESIAVIEDNGKKISSQQMLAAVFFLSRKLKKTIKSQQNIGILLPSTGAGIIANLAVLMRGKTVVNLNYTNTEFLFRSTLEQAQIQQVITSRLFMEKLEQRGINIHQYLAGQQIIILEDVMAKATKKIIALFIFNKLMPKSVLKWLFVKKASVESTAAILFSSGSEGQPKGVKLTHGNILSNVNQVAHVFGLKNNDTVLNALPLFHAFGLTVTMLMPLMKGIPMVCTADPTKVLAIAKLVCKYKITLLCSTSSILNLYTRNPKIHPLMLQSLRMVIAGAEKLPAKVYHEFKEKFNLTIYEGYGATEVAPVASCNLPDVLSPDDWHIHIAHKPGTVGLPLPGCAFRIVDPNTFEDLPTGESGLVLIGGTQVMSGYLNLPEKTKDALIEQETYTWYKTGDKGYLDEEGFLTIVDRYSRFCKIAGEMLSLSQVEQEWQQRMEEETFQVMALSLPDEKKGEQLALLYEGQISENEIKKKLIQSKLPNLMLPSLIRKVTELPKLGSGKRDYQSAKLILETTHSNVCSEIIEA